MITSARRALRDAALASGVAAARDVRQLVRAIRANEADSAARQGHVLIAPPGGGNIGDQAMVEAFLERADGPVVIVGSGEDTIDIPTRHAQRATFVALPALLYQSRGAHRAALDQLARLMAGARSVSVVGADIMDGAYIPRASVSRSMIVRAAALAGRDARVLGFSWPERPLFAARRQLALAAKAGVAILPRDPVSFERLAVSGIPPTRQVADLVFSTPTTSAGLVEELGLDGPYAVVNISGHIGRRVDLVGDYARVVDHLRHRGLTVVVLPHVVTSSADDRVPSARLREAVGGDGVLVVERVPTPAEVRGLTAGAVVTVTGRMHLAIMTLMHGIPAITLATQGKVEGLMSMLGASELCIEPTSGAGERIVSVLDRVIPSNATIRTAIAEALPGVLQASALNFSGLEALKINTAVSSEAV